MNLWCLVYKPASPALWCFVTAARWTEAHASNLTSMPTGGLLPKQSPRVRRRKDREEPCSPLPFVLEGFYRYRGRQDSKLLSSGFRNVYKGLLFSCLLGHNKKVIMVQQANLSGSMDTKMRGNKGSPLPPELPSPVLPCIFRRGCNFPQHLQGLGCCVFQTAP